jgi:hypothetical protein
MVSGYRSHLAMVDADPSTETFGQYAPVIVGSGGSYGTADPMLPVRGQRAVTLNPDSNNAMRVRSQFIEQLLWLDVADERNTVAGLYPARKLLINPGVIGIPSRHVATLEAPRIIKRGLEQMNIHKAQWRSSGIC